ncbi:transketolase [Lachnospiraceae bacterium XBB1006]|nr:transketolase [Lachnospiraceae bacterium XBB1006]
MRNTYLRELYKLAEKDKRVLSLIADNGMIVYDEFREAFPEQYYNFGISEGHMVTAAAGMASCGLIPFAYTIGSFLAYRSCEFLRLDVCLQNLNVKIVGIGAGVTYGYLGPTHHSTEDIAILRAMPNLTILSPATPKEARVLVNYAYEHDGPVYIRLGNNLPAELYAEDMEVIPGKPTTLTEGKDLVVFATGEILNQAKEALDLLKIDGVSAELISVHTIKPLDEAFVLEVCNRHKRIVTVEEHSIFGGLGGAIAEVMAENGNGKKLQRIGLQDRFAKGYGNRLEVLKANDLDGKGIYAQIKKYLQEA